jgi:hypothetical protein
LVAVVVTVIVVALFKVSFWAGPIVSTCYADNEIDPAIRHAIESDARRFVTALLGASPGSAYSQMSLAGQASISARQMEAAASQLKAERETSAPTVTRTLFINSLFGAPTGFKTACDIAGSGGPELLSISSAPKEAHVLLTEGLENAARIFDVWLIQVDGQWRVNGFSANLSALGGRDGDAWWKLAKEQRARGHAFNAAFLYKAAEQTLYRGAFYQRGDWAAFSRDLESFKTPPELNGQGPHSWSLKGHSYSVTQTKMVSLDGGKALLSIYQPSPNWKGEADADRRNRDTIDAFLATHPEWTEAFDAIVVRSAIPGTGQSFGSVYEKGRGYLPQDTHG